MIPAGVVERVDVEARKVFVALSKQTSRPLPISRNGIDARATSTRRTTVGAAPEHHVLDQLERTSQLTARPDGQALGGADLPNS